MATRSAGLLGAPVGGQFRFLFRPFRLTTSAPVRQSCYSTPLPSETVAPPIVCPQEHGIGLPSGALESGLSLGVFCQLGLRFLRSLVGSLLQPNGQGRATQLSTEGGRQVQK